MVYSRLWSGSFIVGYMRIVRNLKLDRPPTTNWNQYVSLSRNSIVYLRLSIEMEFAQHVRSCTKVGGTRS